MAMILKRKPYKVALRELSRRRDVLEFQRVSIWFEGQPRRIVIEFLALADDFRDLLIDAGLGFVSRVHRGVGVAPGLTSNKIEVIDGFLRLPPPSQTQPENITDIKDVVELYETLFMEMCQTCKPIKDKKDDNEVVGRAEMCKMCDAIEDNDAVVCKGINSVRRCFQYIHYNILGSKSETIRGHALYLLETLFSNPFFRSATSKLCLVKSAVYYLLNHYPEEVTKSTGYVWRTEYNDFNKGPKHQRRIEAAIAENPIMKKVYEFGDDEDVPAAEQQKRPKPILKRGRGLRTEDARGTHTEDAEQKKPKQPKYEYSAVGVLQLMANFAKHANDHRRKMNLKIWTDEELVGLLEYHFGGEIDECFFFFWTSLINTDWDKKLRRYVDPPRRGSSC